MASFGRIISSSLIVVIGGGVLLAVFREDVILHTVDVIRYQTLLKHTNNRVNGGAVPLWTHSTHGHLILPEGAEALPLSVTNITTFSSKSQWWPRRAPRRPLRSGSYLKSTYSWRLHLQTVDSFTFSLRSAFFSFLAINIAFSFLWHRTALFALPLDCCKNISAEARKVWRRISAKGKTRLSRSTRRKNMFYNVLMDLDLNWMDFILSSRIGICCQHKV